RYQSLMDAYILDGAEIPPAELRKCWRENTQANLLGDTPRLVEILAKIRNANRSAGGGRRLRVLLVDPPVDWSQIRERGDVRRDLFDGDAHIARVMRDEVYSQGKKALLFAGPAHLVRPRSGRAGGKQARTDPPAGTALARLESAHPGTTASIWVHVGTTDDAGKAAASIRSWPRPSVATIRGTSYEAIQQPTLMRRRPPSLVARKSQDGTD